MRGFDLSDQGIATCSGLMIGNVLYYYIFFHMLGVTALNAYIKQKIVDHPIAGNPLHLCAVLPSCKI